jgi:hypothetical protein
MNGMKTWRIDASPLIFSPFEAERKPAVLPASHCSRLHCITTRQVAATGDRVLNHNWDLALAKVKSANSAKRVWPKSPAQRQ